MLFYFAILKFSIHAMKIWQNCHENAMNFCHFAMILKNWHPWSSQKEPFPNWGKFTNQKDIVCLMSEEHAKQILFCTLIMDIDFFVGKKF